MEKLVKPIKNIVERYWKLSSTKKPPTGFVSPQMRMIENDMKIVHKMYKGTYALKYEEVFKTNREIEKEFNTRKNENNDLPIPKWRLIIARQKFSFRTRPGWNFIPTRIRELKESLYKIEIKKHLKENEQTYRSFTREKNIIGGLQINESQKRKVLEENQKTAFTTKNPKRNKSKKKGGEQTQKNSYLRKNSSDGRNLTRITKPRVLMAAEVNANVNQGLP